MYKFFTTLIIGFWLIITSVFADDSGTKTNSPEPEKQDMPVIAAMEFLQMMDMVENIDLLKDFEYFIEEDGNENKK